MSQAPDTLNGQLAERIEEFKQTYAPLADIAIKGLREIKYDMVAEILEQAMGNLSAEKVEDIHVRKFTPPDETSYLTIPSNKVTDCLSTGIKGIKEHGEQALLANNQEKAESLATAAAALDTIIDGWSKHEYYTTLVTDIRKNTPEQLHTQESQTNFAQMIANKSGSMRGHRA